MYIRMVPESSATRIVCGLIPPLLPPSIEWVGHCAFDRRDPIVDPLVTHWLITDNGWHMGSKRVIFPHASVLVLVPVLVLVLVLVLANRDHTHPNGLAALKKIKTFQYET